MDIDKILQELLNKYNIDIDQSIYKKAINLIYQLMNEIPEGSKIAIRGGGEHTKRFLDVIEQGYCKRNFECIIDNNLSKKNTTKYDLIPINKINEYNIDVIIISSYTYRFDMEIELYNFDEKYKIIDIYDYFFVNNLELSSPFYSYFVHHEPYEEIFLNRKKYLNENNYKLKEFYLEKIILYCLNIRDFLYAIKYIEEYIDNGYEKQKIYKEFLAELNLLLDTIKSKLSKRKHKDIIINLLDSVRYDEICKMKYLSELSKKSILFENAFTMMPWTRQSFEVIFFNKKVIDDNLFELESERINHNNSKLIKLFDDKGYIFKYIGDYGERFFDSQYVERMDYYDYYRYINLTKLQWTMLRTLILSSQPYVFLIHAIGENHEPFLCSNSKKLRRYYNYMENGIYWPDDGWENEDLKEQIKSSCEYVDKQLQWYAKFLNYNCTKIYMSDHGKGTSEKYNDLCIHTMLIIEDNDIGSKKYSDLFSYVNFYNLFYYLINPNHKNYSKIFSEFIEIQILDLYGEVFIDDMLNSKGISFFKDFLQQRGIRTKKDKYIKFITGDEKYFILPDEENNRIYENEYKERIEELRELTKDYFIDIYKYDKFRYSRRIYKTLNINLQQNKN